MPCLAIPTAPTLLDMPVPGAIASRAWQTQPLHPVLSHRPQRPLFHRILPTKLHVPPAKQVTKLRSCLNAGQSEWASMQRGETPPGRSIPPSLLEGPQIIYTCSMHRDSAGLRTGVEGAKKGHSPVFHWRKCSSCFHPVRGHCRFKLFVAHPW